MQPNHLKIPKTAYRLEKTEEGRGSFSQILSVTLEEERTQLYLQFGQIGVHLLIV